MTLLRLVTGVLGSGIIVLTGLVAGRPAGQVWLVAVLAAVSVVAVAVLFTLRPFGGGAVRGIGGLPVPAKLIYTIGFVGGTAYFAASALAICRTARAGDVLAVVVALAIAGFGQFAVRRGLPASFGIVRSLLAVVLTVLLPLSVRPAAELAGADVPLVVVLAALLLACVGWESLPRIDASPGTGYRAAACCAVVIAAGCGWARWAHTSVTPSGHGDALIGALAVLLLGAFAATNTSGIVGFWTSGRSAGVAQLLVCVVVAALIVLTAAVGLDRAWLLVLPGAATATLYIGFLFNVFAPSSSAAPVREAARAGG